MEKKSILEQKTADNDTVFNKDQTLYNKKVKTVPKPSPNIGVDLDNSFYNNIINAGLNSALDISELESFSTASQNRNQLYDLIDQMCEDSTIAAVLETYAEDATEYNDSGKIVWCDSTDENISKYITYLLDTMNVDKNIYSWVYSLCKYGDCYLRLYRQSEYSDPIFDNVDDEIDTNNPNIYTDSNKKPSLNEEVKIKAYSKNDKYAHYIEMVKNPAEMFELTKFGKTYGYIKADTAVNREMASQTTLQYSTYQYKFNRKDVEIFDAKSYVHACLEDASTRVEEKVSIYLDNTYTIEGDTNKYNTADNEYNYNVKKGQSLLWNTFKVWRELQLLESSILLNRVTKSSIVRIIGVEVGDMPKEQVGPHLMGIKQMVEQKAAINTNTDTMSEYTNPGPIENNIYVPTRNGVGAISTQQVGGDVDVKALADLDYFKNKFFGALRVPKQYFGDTDDSAGFDGGTSLSLISSRYAKMVKRIQNTVLQALTDAINLMLIDKGLNIYINRFTLKMQTPSTQEEKDRREILSNKLSYASDVISATSDIEDPITKLKIVKSLLGNVIDNTEVLTYIQDEIDRMEDDAKKASEEDSDEVGDESSDSFEDSDFDFDFDNEPSHEKPTIGGSNNLSSDNDFDLGPEKSETSSSLPSPSDLGVDMTDSNNPELA